MATSGRVGAELSSARHRSTPRRNFDHSTATWAWDRTPYGVMGRDSLLLFDGRPPFGDCWRRPKSKDRRSTEEVPQTARAGLKFSLKFAPVPTLMRRARNTPTMPRDRNADRSGRDSLNSLSWSTDRTPSNDSEPCQIGHVNASSSPSPLQPVTSRPSRLGAEGNRSEEHTSALHSR